VLLFLPATAIFLLMLIKWKVCFSKNNKMEHRYSEITIHRLFYSGLAKLNSIGSLKQCLLKYTQFNLPLIGSLLNENWVHYAFSWTGAIYDLELYFIVLQKNPLLGFILVLVFHILTKYYSQLFSRNDHQYLDFFWC
jgi:hypothetical protein